MDQITSTLVGLGVFTALIPIGVFAIRRVKRSKNLAAMAGMVLLFAPFVKLDPPPPPNAESVARDDDDEPLDGPSPDA